MPPVCVVGSGPLPGVSASRHSAAGQRTLQFASSLARSGQEVDLLLLGEDSRRGELADGIRIDALGDGARLAPAALRAEIARRRPQALVAAGTFASFLCARSGAEPPAWLDLNGDPMAEGQAHALAGATDQPVLDAWWMLAWCLRRGDRFSVVSPSQRLALLGQLGAAGRLSRANAGAELVSVVPEAVEALDPVGERPRGSEPTILFSGSFNSWVDGTTLLAALRIALAEEPRLRFVATGGPAPGLPAAGWDRFRDGVAAFEEAARRRVELAGWVRPEELASIEERASCGVIPELPLVERELGGHNRSLRWLARGIPVVTTELSDLGREIARASAGLVYPPGDARALAEALLRCAREPHFARELAARGRRWALERRSFGATTGPLVAWARDPRPAPDRLDGSAGTFARRHAEMLRDQLHLLDSDG